MATKIIKVKMETKTTKVLTNECENGDGESCYKVGMIHYLGTGVKSNYFKAFGHYEKSCDLNNSWGCSSVGSAYFAAYGVKRDYVKAVQYFEKACGLDAENDSSYCGLGVMYEIGFGVKKDIPKALEYYKKACDLHSWLGCSDYERLKKQINKGE